MSTLQLIREGLCGDTQFTILCVAYNAQHQELYSGSQDCLIKAWDAQTGQLLRKQSGHGGWVTDLLFVPELRLLLSCSIDHTVRVWSDKGKQAQVKVHKSTLQLCPCLLTSRYTLLA